MHLCANMKYIPKSSENNIKKILSIIHAILAYKIMTIIIWNELTYIPSRCHICNWYKGSTWIEASFQACSSSILDKIYSSNFQDICIDTINNTVEYHIQIHGQWRKLWLVVDPFLAVLGSKARCQSMQISYIVKLKKRLQQGFSLNCNAVFLIKTAQVWSNKLAIILK